jgi:cytochrome c oxidase cbb3-type subunit I/II
MANRYCHRLNLGGFGINTIGTIIKRRERHIYVAIYVSIATFVTVAVLHIFNSFELPVSFLKS